VASEYNPRAVFLLFGGGRVARGIRLGLLAALLVAAFVFHASGETLVIVRVVRYALIALIVVGATMLRRRRERRSGSETEAS